MTRIQMQVMWACIESWRSSHISERSREICYEWVLPVYREKFNEPFHQTVLIELAKMGYLKAGDLASGRSRRYYTMPHVQKAEEAIQELLVTN